MKITIVSDDQGNILGAVQGESLTQKQGDVEATVTFLDSHHTHLVDVDDDLASVTDALEYEKRLQHHLQQHLQAQHKQP